MSAQRFATSSGDETRSLGAALAGVLAPGTTVALVGDLGAGKTALAQGLAAGLGVAERVTSPTFTMVASYATDGRRGVELFLHADLYRVGSGAEAEDLAIGELVEDAAIAAVEWGDLAPGAIGAERVVVRLLVGSGEDERVVEIEPGPLEPEVLAGALEPWRVR
jgi:tRNA threonylcarbamoyladenosine biosynthesis protein TsaE